jgi:hypothetical protein
MGGAGGVAPGGQPMPHGTTPRPRSVGGIEAAEVAIIGEAGDRARPPAAAGCLGIARPGRWSFPITRDGNHAAARLTSNRLGRWLPGRWAAAAPGYCRRCCWPLLFCQVTK